MTANNDCCPTDISEEDVIKAMKRISGYIDITPADFRRVYLAAYDTALERLKQSVRARDIMTRTVITLSSDASLAEVAEQLSRNKISGAPVMDKEGDIIGIVSEKDFLSLMGVESQDTFMTVVAICLSDKGCPAISAHKQTAADLMSTPAITVREDATLYEISTLMGEKAINRLPVTDSAGRLTGIVTRSAVVLSFCAIEE